MSETDNDGELGYEYVVALCAAIDEATAAVESNQPGAFSYRGQTLRFAVERMLYIDLVNNVELYELFRDSRFGRRTHTVRLRSDLERRAASILCGPAAAGRISGSGQTFAARALGKARATLRRRSAPLTQPSALAHELTPTREGKALCFVVHHAKFLRFLQPILNELPVEEIAVLSGDLDLREHVEAMGVRFVALRPSTSNGDRYPFGSGLRDYEHATWQFDNLADELERLEARCVVLVEGNHPLDELANQAAKSLGVPSICLQQGWSPIVHNGFRNMTFTSMFVWGDGFARLLEPYNPEQSFVVTGSPALDSRESSHSKLGNVTRGREAIAFFLQPATPLITSSDVDDVHELVLDLATRFAEVQLLVRPHPSGQGPSAAGLSADNVTIVPAEVYTLQDVLDASFAAVSVYSTTLLEAAALGAVPVAYNMTSLPRYVPDLELAGAGVEVRDRDAAFRVLERLITDKDFRATFSTGMDTLRAQFFAGADRRGSWRVAAELAARAGLAQPTDRARSSSA